jgi:Insertion element 4 transposase N-terminal/Transposase DDE domain
MRCAVMTVTTVITVAAGVFAPGHLGELTRIVPFELADAVLAEEGGLQRRVRLLPSRCGLYFLLAMCLFPQCGYLGVWGRLTAGLGVLGLPSPSGRALRDLRRRIGTAPARRLFEVLAGPLGQPRTPGIMFGGYRTVSFDGCKSVRVPDTAANRAWLGKHPLGKSEAAYPALLLMTLVETGTRALLGAVFGSWADGEAAWARKLLPLLDETMLLLADRRFDDGPFLAAVAARKAQFLVRMTAARKPRVLRHLPDGSYLTVISGVKVRVITARVTVTCHDGTSYGDAYRLATTLLDHRACPAQALMSLYHERWEHEITYLALRHTLLNGRVLRSADPAGINQEMWALLAVYQALRTAVTDAVQSVPGTDPDRASWHVAVETAQNLVTAARNITGPEDDLPGDIGRAVLASLHGPRRPRVCSRTVKSPASRWSARPDGKPRTTRQITAITTSIDARHYKPPKPKPTLIDKLRQAAERGEPLDKLLKRLTPRHWLPVNQSGESWSPGKQSRVAG